MNFPHEIARIEPAAIFDVTSRAAHRAVCACGWHSAATDHDVAALVALHNAHAERAERLAGYVKDTERLTWLEDYLKRDGALPLVGETLREHIDRVRREEAT